VRLYTRPCSLFWVTEEGTGFLWTPWGAAAQRPYGVHSQRRSALTDSQRRSARTHQAG
jgi:hypothetical protein